MYKYVYNGHDVANITIEGTNNERVINHNESRSFVYKHDTSVQLKHVIVF